DSGISPSSNEAAVENRLCITSAHGALTSGEGFWQRLKCSFRSEEPMPAKAFVIAMAADIARSDYAKPTLVRSRSREWLIACRWGPEGEYLSIATAGPVTEPLALAAPQAITQLHRFSGVLGAHEEPQPPGPSLMVRRSRGGTAFAGPFFPAH